MKYNIKNGILKIFIYERETRLITYGYGIKLMNRDKWKLNIYNLKFLELLNEL